MIRTRLAAALLRATRWTPVGDPPVEPKAVLIAAPHTSNLDFLVMLMLGAWFGVPINWVGKHTLFESPLAWFFRASGGIPVDRRAAGGAVERISAVFAARERVLLAIAPEGSRQWRPHWRSGFYRIAEAAGVPLVLSFLDWKTRSGGFGPTLWPTGDLAADMDRVRAFYSDKRGRRHELFGPVRLAEEGPLPEPVDSSPTAD